ncbi:MAG: methyltransferase domain-containing protein [Bacteroidetes bacterium]|nr:methyltransferase domain-containing protein [Bacteroidota bacterium]
MKTKQIDFWKSDFGKEYTDRCSRSAEEWDKFYVNTWGKTKIEMNQSFLGSLSKDIKILEVGCNTGMQLNGLQRMNFENIYGVELQSYAVEEAKKYTKNINIICGSGFDLPFKDKYFDVVCTNGVLIHISPDDLPKIMSEMYRCSKKYIWGFEYFAENITEIDYRGNKNYLWKADYASLFMKQFPDLKLVKREKYPYITNPENVDHMYLLEKQ